MRYFIDYAVRCERGNIRAKNQDNFLCLGNYLESENTGLTEILKSLTDNKSRPMFAVFDGMGGEKYGETAAYLAAKSFNGFYDNSPKIDMKQFLSQVCSIMNEEICSFAKAKRTEHVGTTAAILAFDKKEVYICNIGDSRVFQYSGKSLTQISRDHVTSAVSDKKPALSQHLGISETEFIIEPYIAKGEYSNKDRYLVCSDGLTDMVSEKEIEKMLSEHKTVSDCADALMENALSNGGIDNITIILCELRKHRK